MRRFLVGFGESVSAIGLIVAAICLIVIVIINGANVVARYLFSSPFSWAEEAMVYILIAGVFWGAIAVAWRQADICIDIFISYATGRARQMLQIGTNLISIAILCWLVFVSARVTIQLGTFDLRSTALNLPMWIPNTAFVSGLLLVVLMMAARLCAPRDNESRPSDQASDEDG